MNSPGEQDTPGKTRLPLPIGELLKELRRSLGQGMSQKKLADRIGLSQSFVARIESRDYVPSDEVLKRISLAFAEDKVEKRKILRKLRQSALYSKKPEAYEDALKPDPEGDEESNASTGYFYLQKSQQALLHEERKRQNISMRDLCVRTDIGQIRLIDILEGSGEVSFAELHTLCLALDCDVNKYLLGAGLFPEAFKRALMSNPLLLDLVTKLCFVCDDLDEVSLTLYLDMVHEYLRKHVPVSIFPPRILAQEI